MKNIVFEMGFKDMTLASRVGKALEEEPFSGGESYGSHTGFCVTGKSHLLSLV